MLFKALHCNMTCDISHRVLNNGGITITRTIEGIPLYHEKLGPQSLTPF